VPPDPPPVPLVGPAEVVEFDGDVVVVEGEPVVVLVVDSVESLEPLLSSPPQLTHRAEIEIRVM